MDFETEDGTMSGSELAASALAKKAFAGDVQAFETLRDTVGEKPVDKVMMAEVEPYVIAAVEKMVKDDEGTSG